MSRPDDAMFEFAEEPPDGVFQQGADTRAVPPPVHNEIDGLVDAISAGGRPRLSSESDVVAEADDSELADLVVMQHAVHRSGPNVFHTAAFRYIACSIAAFAFGTVIAWSVLRSFDASPAPVAVHQPTAVEPPRTPAPTAIAPQTSAPTASASTPRAATIEREPTRVEDAAPAAAAARDQRAAVTPSPRITATEIAPPRRTAAPIATPNTTAAAPVSARPIAPVVAPPVDAAPRDGGDLAAVASSASAAIIAPPPVAPASAPASAARSAIASEEKAVLETLRGYKQAYQALDVTATAAVWPSVDRRALARAFSTIKSQQIELENCKVAIAQTTATTHCRGTVEYVRRIGSSTLRTGHQDFVFKMRKLGTDWFIDDVDASESAVARR